MGNNTAGQTLNDAVGWAGRLWDADYRQLNFNSGYPAYTYADDLITDGPAQYLRACTNESFQQTTDHDAQIAGGQRSQGGQRTGDETHLFSGFDVVDAILNNHAVSIQEDGGAQRGRGLVGPGLPLVRW